MPFKLKLVLMVTILLLNQAHVNVAMISSKDVLLAIMMAFVSLVNLLLTLL